MFDRLFVYRLDFRPLDRDDFLDLLDLFDFLDLFDRDDDDLFDLLFDLCWYSF